MHLKKFQTTQLFMLFLSKVARSQSPDVSFRLAIKSHVLYFLCFIIFYYILLCFTIFYYIFLYFAIFYYVLIYFSMFYYIFLCFTIFYCNMVLLKPQIHNVKRTGLTITIII